MHYDGKLYFIGCVIASDNEILCLLSLVYIRCGVSRSYLKCRLGWSAVLAWSAHRLTSASGGNSFKIMENHIIWHRYVAYIDQATTNSYIDYCLWLDILTIGMFKTK